MTNIKGKNAWTALSIIGEYVDSTDKMESLDNKNITIFGGARFKPESDDYKKTYEFSKHLSDKGYSIITGGGPGIMEAANKGNFDSTCDTSKSIGIGIELPFESGNNEYVNNTYNMQLKYFFIRKYMLMNYSVAFVVFKGGFGTLDELFEVVTLMQTGKIPVRPIYLVDTVYWSPLIEWIKSTLLDDNATINVGDLDLFCVIDSVDEITL